MKEKLKRLAELEGYDDVNDFLEVWVNDSECPGICMNDDCEYSTEVEPDSDSGYCENCETNTVSSGLILGGLI